FDTIFPSHLNDGNEHDLVAAAETLSMEVAQSEALVPLLSVSSSASSSSRSSTTSLADVTNSSGLIKLENFSATSPLES
ncbi:hypothetical protein ABTP95_21940, partial [Acinetobacter baumannii]